MSADRLPFDETFLKQKLQNNPDDWQTRRAIAHGLFDKQAYEEAADILWNAPEVPATDLDIAFMIRVLAKARPRRAIRLISAVLELNRGKAVQNMGMTNALMHHGMVLQAARFYSAAVEADPSMVNPDLEYFMLWSDDAYTMWGNFEKRAPKLSDLPWMIRDPKEALRLTSRVSLHTTPIIVPNLPSVAAEELQHEMYQQEAKHEAKITPPPAVRIPIDSVNPKDRLIDEVYGAVPVSAPVSVPLAAPAAQPAASGFPSTVVFPDTSRPTAPAAIPVAAPAAVPIAPAAVQAPIAQPIAAPVAVPVAQPIAAPAAYQAPAAVPLAAPAAIPVAAPVPVAASRFTEESSLPPLVPTPPLAVSLQPEYYQPAAVPQEEIPMAAPVAVPAAIPVAAPAPTGAPTRALLPSGPAPTGTPTRALLPSGQAPTGTPTRALLPSGTPPVVAPGGQPRRLITPSKPPGS